MAVSLNLYCFDIIGFSAPNVHNLSLMHRPSVIEIIRKFLCRCYVHNRGQKMDEEDIRSRLERLEHAVNGFRRFAVLSVVLGVDHLLNAEWRADADAGDWTHKLFLNASSLAIALGLGWVAAKIVGLAACRT
jgi:hypothetical protein